MEYVPHLDLSCCHLDFHMIKGLAPYLRNPAHDEAVEHAAM